MQRQESEQWFDSGKRVLGLEEVGSQALLAIGCVKSDSFLFPIGVALVAGFHGSVQRGLEMCRSFSGRRSHYEVYEADSCLFRSACAPETVPKNQSALLKRDWNFRTVRDLKMQALACGGHFE